MSEYSAIPPFEPPGSDNLSHETGASQRGHQFFWRSCLVLIPLALLACVLPYAEVRVLKDPDETANVFMAVEFAGWFLVAIASAIAGIVCAPRFLRAPVRTLKYVCAGTLLLVCLSSGFVFQLGQANAASWEDGDKGFGREWYPSDNGGGLRFQATLNRLPSVSPLGGEEPVNGFGIRPKGPWIAISTAALVLLTLIGIFCSVAGFTKTRAGYTLASFVTAGCAVALGGFWLFLAAAGRGLFA